jgi:hypothetical protein
VGGVNDTADHWWAVAMTPLTKYDTADQCALKFEIRWLLLKEISIKKIIHRQIVMHYTYIYNIYAKNIGVSKGSLLWTAVSMTSCLVVGGVNDTTALWWVVSMKPLNSGGWCQ